MNKSALKNNVKNLRVGISITQQDLANQVGVSRQTIISIEKGNYTPSVLLAIQITHALNKKLEEVFYIK